MLPLEDTWVKGTLDFCIISYNCMWIYSDLKLKSLIFKKLWGSEFILPVFRGFDTTKVCWDWEITFLHRPEITTIACGVGRGPGVCTEHPTARNDTVGWILVVPLPYESWWCLSGPQDSENSMAASFKARAENREGQVQSTVSLSGPGKGLDAASGPSALAPGWGVWDVATCKHHWQAHWK